MNAINIKSSFTISIALTFLLGLHHQCVAQFDQHDQSSFMNIIESDSEALELLHESRVKNLYYVQDEISSEVKPLMKLHLKTSGWRHERLDNQFKHITEKALSLGLNSLRVDSSIIKGIVCEYWVSLYYIDKHQINRNESIVGDNLICVFGKFDDKYKKGKSFKINGRKLKLMPYEYIKRNIAIGKRGSVELNRQRIELVGGENGGEIFIDSSRKFEYASSSSAYITIVSNIGDANLSVRTPIGEKKIRGLKRNFAYFLYNIYNEKVVIPKTRDALVAAKRKEWREKKAKEEAKKKAKEEKKKKG